MLCVCVCLRSFNLIQQGKALVRARLCVGVHCLLLERTKEKKMNGEDETATEARSYVKRMRGGGGQFTVGERLIVLC